MVKLQFYKVLIFGPPGAGKSSLFQVLQGIMPNPTRQSTGVLNFVQLQMDLVIGSSSKWYPFSRKDALSRLRKVVEINTKLLNQVDLQNNCATQRSDDATDGNAVNSYPTSRSDVTHGSTIDSCSTNRSTTNGNTTDLCDTSLMKTEKELLKISESTLDKFADTVLICYDSGGHLEFFDLMPALTTLPTGHIMVFDMEKGLGTCEVDGFYIDNMCHSSCGKTEFDCTKLLQIAVGNIQSSATKKASNKILVVGTHLDKCGSDDASKHKKVRNLDRHIYEEVLGRDPNSIAKKRKRRDSQISSQYIHPISNLEVPPERNEVATEIRTAIEDMSKMGSYRSEIPAEWYLFQLEIQEKQKNYIGKGEYIGIAAKLNMNPEKAKQALRFFHELGILLFYEKIVNVVFCHPQWLFNCLTNLIKQKYSPLNFEIENDIKVGNFRLTNLMEIFGRHLDVDGDLETRHLMEIFVHHNIMAPRPVPSDDIYFMPAILKASPKNVLLESCGRKVGEALYVKFDNLYVPRGVFCCLVVKLMQRGWKLREKIIYKDLIVFEVFTKRLIVLRDNVTSISFEMHNEDNSEDIAVLQARGFLSELAEHLNSVCKQMKIVDELKFGFFCASEDCPQIACLEPYSLKINCESCNDSSFLNESQLIWTLPTSTIDHLISQVHRLLGVMLCKFFFSQYVGIPYGVAQCSNGMKQYYYFDR